MIRKSNVSKWLLLVFIIMMAAFISACSSDEEPKGTDSQPPPQTSDPTPSSNNDPPAEPPTKLTMITHSHPAWPVKEDWLVIELLEEHANVELEVSGYQGNWWDAIPLVISSGNMPDLMWMSGSENFHRHGQYGALIDLMQHLDKMPNFAKWMEQYPLQVEYMLTHDNKLFGLPTAGTYYVESVFMYREDIFEQHGLSMPKDYDEFYEVLKTLKDLYPDSYPYYAAGWGAIQRFTTSNNVGNEYYYDEQQDMIRYGPITENFRYLVEFLSKLYADGLIPLEFGNMNNDKRDELIYSDRVFVYPGYINNIAAFNKNARETNPNVKWAVMDPPAGLNGDAYHRHEYVGTAGLAITSTTKNLEAALRLVDSMYTEEGRDLMSWGKEGVTYEIVDGQKRYLDVIPDENTRSIDFGLRTPGFTAWHDPQSDLALYMGSEEEDSYIRAAQHTGPPIPPFRLTSDERSEVSIKNQAIHSHVAENISKFIIGSRPLTEWDAYVQEVINLGIEDVVQVYQQAYDRANN